MAFAKITHTGHHKGKVQVLVSMYLEEADPNYDKHYVRVPIIPEIGYPGRVDKEGIPVDQEDYDAWEASLPHVWQNNPFHNHCIYGYPGSKDAVFKDQIANSLSYFYAFHQQMWDSGRNFIDEWKKVPFKAGTIRSPFVTGSLDALNKQECLTKAEGVWERKTQLEVGEHGELPPLGIGEKGTIVIGDEAEDRISNWGQNQSILNLGVPADGTGTIDTVEIFASTNMSGCKVGTLYLVSGSTFHCRDSVVIGDVATGSKQEFTGLSISVTEGDYIGSHWTGGALEKSTSGYTGTRSKSGDYLNPDDEASFSYLQTGDAISVHGIGGGNGGQEWHIEPLTEYDLVYYEVYSGSTLLVREDVTDQNAAERAATLASLKSTYLGEAYYEHAHWHESGGNRPCVLTAI